MEECKRRKELGLPDIYLYEKNTRSVTYTDFVNKELVLFSNLDNERSIPSLVDGLKPGQRKVSHFWLHLFFQCKGKERFRSSLLVAACFSISGFTKKETDKSLKYSSSAAWTWFWTFGDNWSIDEVGNIFPFLLQVLYTCIKRNDKREVKVAQLAGSVAEHSAYHHGEASLMSTIINLAQDYVGSNNINLLQPIGQFGTRLQGGKDSASPRYIFTMLR